MRAPGNCAVLFDRKVELMGTKGGESGREGGLVRRYTALGEGDKKITPEGEYLRNSRRRKEK